MTFQFIHTADIHLDSPLKSLALRNQALADVVANATRQVLVRIVDLCLTENVDALLIAGDLYDGSQTSMKTARFLASQMRRLGDANILVYIIRGNHDAESKITRELTLGNHVHVFSSKPEAVVFAPTDIRQSETEQKVVLHGTSFKKPHAPKSLLPDYTKPNPQAINIGMMHTSLDGSEQHDPYAPCSLTDLQNHGFDYWALGHIHKRSVYTDNQCTVVMPGIPQGRDIGEAGSKSVTLVTISDDKQVDITEHLLAVAQFETLTIKLDHSHEWHSVIDKVINEINRASNHCDADHLIARVLLQGQSVLTWQLHRDTDLLINEIEARLDDDDHLWLDKLIVNCEPVKGTSANFDTGPQQELSILMSKQIEQSTQLIEDAKQTINAMFKSLPSELRARFGETEEQLDKNIKSLARQGSKQVIAKLHGDTTTEDQASN